MKQVKFDKKAFAIIYFYGLFALGLVFAQVMVQARSKIQLSRPIRLTEQGLSVSLPQGPGWQILNRWKYDRNNSYLLNSQYTIKQYTIAQVRWQYRLADRPAPPETLLDQYLARFSLPHQQISHISEGTNFVWTPLYPSEGQEEVAIGLTVLEPGRTLLLEVQVRNQPMLAEQLFLELAKSVQYKSSQFDQTGRWLTEAVQAWDSDPEGPLKHPSFLISDTSGEKIGYSITRSPDHTQPGSDWKLQTETTCFIQSGRLTEQYREQLFVDPFLSNLDWNCVYQGSRFRQPVQYRMTSLEDGSLRQEDSNGNERILWPRLCTIPDSLVPLTVTLMLNQDTDKVLIDVVSCRGEVVPTLIKKIPLSEAGARASNLHTAVRVDYLHTEENYEELYFDENGVLIGKLEVIPNHRPRVWETATEEEILFHFGNLFDRPEQSAKLLH